MPRNLRVISPLRTSSDSPGSFARSYSSRLGFKKSFQFFQRTAASAPWLPV